MTKRWILVVDDDADFRECVWDLFRMEGFGVALAEGAQSALRILAAAGEDIPKLILLDMRMPGMNGLEFLKRLNADMPELASRVPVLFCTASPGMVPRSEIGPRRQMVAKPSGIDELVGRARKLMHRQEGQSLPAS